MKKLIFVAVFISVAAYAAVKDLKGNQLTVKNITAGSVAATVQGAAAQSANLFNFKNSTGTVLSSISSAGTFTGSVTGGVSGILCSARLVIGASAAITNQVGNCTFTIIDAVTTGVSTLHYTGFATTPHCNVTVAVNTPGFCIFDTGTTTSVNLTCFKSDGTNDLINNTVDLVCHGT